MTKMQIVCRGLLGGSAVFALAACDPGGGKKDTVVEPPKVVTTAQEDKFGMSFGADFRADPNSEPAQVNDGDVVPVSFTDEPINITP